MICFFGSEQGVRSEQLEVQIPMARCVGEDDVSCGGGEAEVEERFRVVVELGLELGGAGERHIT